MLAIISAFFSWLAGRFHSRAVLELEVIALRHQLGVLRRRWLLLAEGHLTRPLFGCMLRRIATLPAPVPTKNSI